ncbi:hypothetical protein SASPL_128704 [Salvia splendens]|uniref:Protein kinase domain-containing protein n=1 Tax=Salvia splendens TaxID=180675 RepID=A0A8X8ZNS5_SALSN|nr:hypothetical protein SASPL_128704 [Salvia splendens]
MAITTLASSLQFPAMLLLPLLLLSAAAVSDLNSDRAALLALRSAVGGRTLFWNTTLTTPCSWPGVLCEDNRVTVLRLPAASLSGSLPGPALSNLTALHTLSLRLNHLSGPLPSDLSSLTQLRNLYLQGNRFSGPPPDSIFSLHALVRLNLASNNFSGPIAPAFNKLARLRTLFLENNHFAGNLPEIHLPNLDQFNVSFNDLNGSVPEGLLGRSKDSFLGTSLCGKPLDTVCAETPAIAAGGGVASGGGGGGGGKKLSGGAIAGIAIGSVLGLLLLLLLLFILCRKRSGKKSRAVDVAAFKNQESDSSAAHKPAAAEVDSSGDVANENAKSNDGNANANAKKLVFFGSGARLFDLEELLRASAEVLGKGTFGTAYKAVLEVGTVVAVKRLKDVTLSEKDFKDRIESVGAMDHQNLVPLRAYYYSREEKLLVYDYMPMGSLSALLHGHSSPLQFFVNFFILSYYLVFIYIVDALLLFAHLHCGVEFVGFKKMWMLDCLNCTAVIVLANTN